MDKQYDRIAQKKLIAKNNLSLSDMTNVINNKSEPKSRKLIKSKKKGNQDKTNNSLKQCGVIYMSPDDPKMMDEWVSC